MLSQIWSSVHSVWLTFLRHTYYNIFLHSFLKYKWFAFLGWFHLYSGIHFCTLLFLPLFWSYFRLSKLYLHPCWLLMHKIFIEQGLFWLAEILRVSGRISNHGFSDYDRLQRGSPNPVPSLDVMPDVGGKSLGSWNGNGWNNMQHEVSWGFMANQIRRIQFIFVYPFLGTDSCGSSQMSNQFSSF